MTIQLMDRFAWLKPFEKFLWAVESLPTRFATGVVTMCDSLRDEVLKVREHKVFVVKDVSLLDYYGDSALAPPQALDDIRANHDKLFMYIGNLEFYQGIDLMLQAFALQQSRSSASAVSTGLVVVGGDAQGIEHYRQLAKDLGIEDSCFFLGPQPVGLLGKLMDRADVMLSPRIQGTNTPLKLYSYLDSGVPVLATDLQTHTQVVTKDQAMLCQPTPEAMADKMAELLESEKLGQRIAQNAKTLIERDHSLVGFRTQILEIYRLVTSSPQAAKHSDRAIPGAADKPGTAG